MYEIGVYKKKQLSYKKIWILKYINVSSTLNVGDNDGDMSESKLTERQEKILNLIKMSPTMTAKQMSETLSVSQRTIERDLTMLKEKKILSREGKDNNGVWVINKD